jgi:tRNA (cytidine32/uridine32-2'-O)-methyltransferase
MEDSQVAAAKTRLAQVRVVMVEPSHPGNIGATARAMKNMMLSQLVLVNPASFPHAEATARAAGADDLLANARVVATLDDAIADCAWVVGTSARVRRLGWPLLDPRAFAQQAWQEAVSQPVALLFGRERVGLSNEELERCHAMVYIPTNPEYSSLNVASAVQVLCYELLQSSVADEGSGLPQQAPEMPYATAQELEALYEHLQRVLAALAFLKTEQPTVLMRRLRRLYNRARLDRNELNILRGILTATESKLS